MQQPILSAIRRKLFKAALSHIPDHGITLRAVAAAAPMFNLPSSITGLFPGGDSDIVGTFLDHLREQTMEHYEVQEDSRPRDIVSICTVRLRLMQPYVQHFPKAIAEDPLQCTKKLYELADTIVNLAGFKSTSMSWYGKRAAIAGAFASTELYMTQDRSPAYRETFNFLQRRISDMEQMERAANGLSQVLNFAANSVEGYFHSRGGGW